MALRTNRPEGETSNGVQDNNQSGTSTNDGTRTEGVSDLDHLQDPTNEEAAADAVTNITRVTNTIHVTHTTNVDNSGPVRHNRHSQDHTWNWKVILFRAYIYFTVVMFFLSVFLLWEYYSVKLERFFQHLFRHSGGI